jgi:hemerythrin-like domain-containing protein
MATKQQSRKSASSRTGSRSASGQQAARGRGAPRRRATSTGSRSASRSGRSVASGRGSRTDLTALLKKDHDTVDRMFKQYDRMKEGDERKQSLCETIIAELKVHAQCEEEIFYPALHRELQAAGDDEGVDLVDEANVEHDTFKWLIAALEESQGDEAATDARVKVLGEYVKHHVKEEEGEIFKAARRTNLDLVQLGREFKARKAELKGETSEEGAPEAGMVAGRSREFDERAAR